MEATTVHEHSVNKMFLKLWKNLNKKSIYFVQLYGRQKIEAAVSPLKALIQKSKHCFLYIRFPLRSQFEICLHLIESGQQDNL